MALQLAQSSTTVQPTPAIKMPRGGASKPAPAAKASISAAPEGSRQRAVPADEAASGVARVRHRCPRPPPRDHGADAARPERRGCYGGRTPRCGPRAGPRCAGSGPAGPGSGPGPGGQSHRARRRARRHARYRTERSAASEAGARRPEASGEASWQDSPSVGCDGPHPVARRGAVQQETISAAHDVYLFSLNTLGTQAPEPTKAPDNNRDAAEGPRREASEVLLEAPR